MAYKYNPNGGEYEYLRLISHPHEEYRYGDYIVVNVCFDGSTKEYCYQASDNLYEPGERIRVSVYGEIKEVTVKSILYYTEETYPFKVLKLNRIIGPGDDSTMVHEIRLAEMNDEAQEVARELRERIARDGWLDCDFIVE